MELVADSSSASASLFAFIVFITFIEQISSDCVKISGSKGSAFFIRYCYLSKVSPDELRFTSEMSPCQTLHNNEGNLTNKTSHNDESNITNKTLRNIANQNACEGIEFRDEKEDDILDAAFCYTAEQKARSYLFAAEQCRFGLTRKLLLKGFAKNHIERALNYLEDEGLLCDKRFARAWLNTRASSKNEGRTKLYSLLLAKGISSGVAKSALDEYFTDVQEQDICKRAITKCKECGITDASLFLHLSKKGFSQKLIRETLSNI